MGSTSVKSMPSGHKTPELEQDEANLPHASLLTDNLDYDELKHLIKAHTTKDQLTAIAIPGHHDAASLEFEESFHQELCGQYDRVDLFVRSKAGELNRRLGHAQKNILQFTSDIAYEATPRQSEKLEKYGRLVNRCDKDIRNLERFVNAQRTAFHKILKKYKKWTGSSRLSRRFHEEKLAGPTSLGRRALRALRVQSDDAHAAIVRLAPTTPPTTSSSHTPAPSARKARAPKPRSRSRRPSARDAAPVVQPRGWNEYDNASDAGEEEPYYILVPAPGESAVVRTLVAIYRRSGDKLRSWFVKTPPALHARETSPLLSPPAHVDPRDSGHSPADLETPRPMSTTSHASTFSFSAATTSLTSPATPGHRRKTRQLRRTISLASILISAILLAISSRLLMLGKHGPRMDVDVGVVVSVVAAVLVAVMGVVEVVHRAAGTVGALEACLLGAAFAGVGVWAGALLVEVMGNASLRGPTSG